MLYGLGAQRLLSILRQVFKRSDRFVGTDATTQVKHCKLKKEERSDSYTYVHFLHRHHHHADYFSILTSRLAFRRRLISDNKNIKK